MIQFRSFVRFSKLLFDTTYDILQPEGGMNMLSKPDAGWSNFSLCEKEFFLSYLTNIPFEWLDQAIHGLETLLPFTVHGFCEPGRMLCTVSYWNCHIIFEDEDRAALCKEDAEWYIAHTSMLDFCQKLYDDISRDIEAWARWMPVFDAENKEEEEKIYSEIKLALAARLARWKELILENQDDFGGHMYFL